MLKLNFQEASVVTLLAQLSPDDPQIETLLLSLRPERREVIRKAANQVRPLHGRDDANLS